MNSTHIRAAFFPTASILFVTAHSMLMCIDADAAEQPNMQAVASKARALEEAERTAPNEPLATTAKIVTRPSSKQSEHSSKRLARKIIEPIRATFVELSHPIELLKSAQRFIWPKSSAAELDDHLAGRLLVGRALDIDLNKRAPIFSVTSKAPILATGQMPLYRYVLPVSNETLQPSTAQLSTTQLQVRMRGDWSMLYEMNSTSTTLDRDEIAIGLGVRRSF